MLTGTVCALLTSAGLGVALLFARRRRYALALRTAAVALLPAGLAMTGVVRFVLTMAFSPVAWAGFGVLGLAVVLAGAARLADRRSRGAGRRAAPGGGAAALPRPGRHGGDADDFSDIEAILRKHGI